MAGYSDKKDKLAGEMLKYADPDRCSCPGEIPEDITIKQF